ncbi:metalloprotease 1 [Pochonia chlamydosporia 170]|uniref:Metalloprotease 1 n=1 Tax=Pochonia chlamydosporia 170 TaxID=1380566 RepID=A0A179FV37_METCM|nr:metalloprotease 1 [Pochonia chlamydosporia 170]OAQ69237.1 metalloprotease 1 [Pochonia chlamydosporia 170]
MLLFLVSGLMAAACVANPMDMTSRPVHYCGARSVSAEEREIFKRQGSQPDNGADINLGCVVHLCCVQGAKCPSDSVAQKAVDQMNAFLDGSKIKFTMQNVSRIDDARCTAGLTNGQAMDSLKAEVHQGNTSTLNIVYLPTNQGAGVKGVCVLPQPGTNIARSIGNKDGCVVAMDTLPNESRGNGGTGEGNPPGGQLGGLLGSLFGRQSGTGINTRQASPTTTHEMGHWLSLPHAGLGGQTGGAGVRNIMDAVSVNGVQYKFSQAQFDQMRQAALSRLKYQNVTITNKNRPPTTPQNPATRPKGNPKGNSGLELLGPGNRGHPAKSGQPQGPKQNPQCSPQPRNGTAVSRDRSQDGLSARHPFPVVPSEPEEEADTPSPVHFARREGANADANELELVHIAQLNDAGEPDDSGLVHIARKKMR